MVVHNGLCAIGDQLQTTAALDEMRTITPGQNITVLYTLWLSGYDVFHYPGPLASRHACGPSTSCTGVWLAITMLQYYICLGIVLTVILVLGLGLGFGIILYFVIGT